MKPHVTVYDAVSADGSIEGFEPDIGLFYELARAIPEDCTLMGSATLAAASADDSGGDPLPAPAADDKRPIMAVVDSRGVFRGYRGIMEFGAWSRAVALCTDATPEEHLAYLRDAGVEAMHFTGDRVPLAEALDALAETYGVSAVRVESGGILNGELIAAGLVDEVWMLVHPVLAGPGRSMYRPSDARAVALEFARAEPQRDEKLLVRYRVAR